jgi:two-component system sensor histidine kinase KdpD
MPGSPRGKAPKFKSALDYVTGIAVVGACTAISVRLQSHLAWENFAMVYLVGVTAVSVRCRRSAAILTTVLSVTAFYYFIVPFHDSFVLEDSTYLVTLSAMLVVALVISTLIDKVRSQAAAVRDGELAIQTERMRSSLLSAVSHDIKTPLSLRDLWRGDEHSGGRRTA